MATMTYHQTRFIFEPKREILWKTLCRYYFKKLIHPEFHVLELGAGYAYFINHVLCKKRTAVDQWPLLPRHVQAGVEARVGDVTHLEFIPDHSVDFIFASNLFEHLTRIEFSEVLIQVRQKLKPDGTLNILQPNYKRATREYFDDYTHISIYSDTSMCDFLMANGYRIIECIPGFLPLTIKSNLPIVPWLIRLYLCSPWKPLAKQMWVRATPDHNMSERTS